MKKLLVILSLLAISACQTVVNKDSKPAMKPKLVYKTKLVRVTEQELGYDIEVVKNGAVLDKMGLVKSPIKWNIYGSNICFYRHKTFKQAPELVVFVETPTTIIAAYEILKPAGKIRTLDTQELDCHWDKTK